MMALGLSVQVLGDGNRYVVLTLEGERLWCQGAIADKTSVDQTIDTLIKGLKDARAQFKREESGLVVVQEVPDGLRKPT